MATEVLQFDLRSGPAAVNVRGDVQALLVVVTRDGSPVNLQRLPRPMDGVLRREDLTAGAPLPARAALVTPVRAPFPVSVVVPTRERPADLTRCLQALAGVADEGHEVIVVDNDPATDRTKVIADQFGARYVLERERGLNRARNAGVAAARHELVAFVDDDVVVSRRG